MDVEPQSKFEYLQTLIWKTRLAHIHAEKRLLALESLTQHATLYFACWTSALTLLTLFNTSRILTLLSIVVAVITTLCTVYASSQNYGVRALQMRQSHLDLQELWLEFDDAKNKDDVAKAKFADEAGKRYVDILSKTENHKQIDYEATEKCSSEGQTFLHLLTYLSVRFCVYCLPVLLGLLLVIFLPV